MGDPRRVSRAWRGSYEALTSRVAADFDARAYSRPAPDNVYHFTDCSGLVGILREKTLWASLATSLNDRSELEYGRVIAREVVSEFPAKSLNLAEFEAAVSKQAWQVYVVSFCESADTALHWLHYGRSGSGAAIGFNAAGIQRDPYELFPILYDRDEQTQWITNVVRGVDRALGHALTLTTDKGDRELLSELAIELLAANLLRVTPRMKSSAFEAEREWRLVAYVPRGTGVPTLDPSSATWFRPAGGRIIPFRKLTYDVLPIQEVVLGSSSPMQQDPAALKLLLDESLGHGNQISVSESNVLVRV